MSPWSISTEQVDINQFHLTPIAACTCMKLLIQLMSCRYKRLPNKQINKYNKIMQTTLVYRNVSTSNGLTITESLVCYNAFRKHPTYELAAHHKKMRMAATMMRRYHSKEFKNMHRRNENITCCLMKGWCICFIVY